MKKISKEELTDLCAAKIIMTYLEKTKVFENTDVLYSLAKYQRVSGMTFEDMAKVEIEKYEDFVSKKSIFDKTKNFLSNLNTLIEIVESLLAAENTEDILAAIKYQFNFPGQQSLDDILDEIMSFQKELRE